MAHQVIQVNVNITLTRPGRYDIDIPQLRTAVWVAHPLPATTAGTAFVATGVGAAGTADTPIVPVPQFAPAFDNPASLATPTLATPTFSPAFPAAAMHPASTSPDARNLPLVSPTFALNTPATPAAPAPLTIVAPTPTPFFAAPAFLTEALPGGAGGDVPTLATTVFFVTDPSSTDDAPPSNAPRTPPPSPARTPAASPALPPVTAAMASPSVADVDFNAVPPAPVHRRARARRTPAVSPARPPVTAATASPSVVDDDAVPFKPLTPAPIHRRARARRESPSPPPVPATVRAPRPPPMSPFGGANAVEREDPVEDLAI
ncbi:hypothetical protein FA95DRAFT_1613640 [Auriscalpium vulgare]|uniref:Uncharacterized protein n=1 Tax=Auriscalpium vulgare TaxID=40419 RepID=A0ACB8R2K9_9AGAM|nr:hypothetical protein FA95DRAFT_1613640 [Auriscalpium vulgare]